MGLSLFQVQSQWELSGQNLVITLPAVDLLPRLLWESCGPIMLLVCGKCVILSAKTVRNERIPRSPTCSETSPDAPLQGWPEWWRAQWTGTHGISSNVTKSAHNTQPLFPPDAENSTLQVFRKKQLAGSVTETVWKCWFLRLSGNKTSCNKVKVEGWRDGSDA